LRNCAKTSKPFLENHLCWRLVEVSTKQQVQKHLSLLIRMLMTIILPKISLTCLRKKEPEA
jgi:hypothetical protein